MDLGFCTIHGSTGKAHKASCGFSHDDIEARAMIGSTIMTLLREALFPDREKGAMTVLA